MKKTLDKPEQSEEAFGCPTWDCAGVRVSARVTMESREVLLSSFKVTEVFVFVFFFCWKHDPQDTGDGVPLQAPETLTLYELFITELCCV